MTILENRKIENIITEFKSSGDDYQLLLELCKEEKKKINDLLFIAKINNLGKCIKDFLLKLESQKFVNSKFNPINKENSYVYFQINDIGSNLIASESISFTPMFRSEGSSSFFTEGIPCSLSNFIPRELIQIDGLYELGFDSTRLDDNYCVVSSNLLNYDNRSLKPNPETIEKEIKELFISKKYLTKFEAISLKIELEENLELKTDNLSKVNLKI